MAPHGKIRRYDSTINALSRLIDSAFLGTLLLFQAKLNQQNRQLAFSGASNRIVVVYI